jgi:hypothetical protein
MILDIDSSIRELRRHVAKLTATIDRPIARRNARKRVLASLRKIRTLIDDAYPAIVNRSEPRTRRSPAERIKALEKAGWVRVGNISEGYAVAGVPVKVIKWRTIEESESPRTYVKGKGWVSGVTKTKITHVVRLVPRWAFVIGPDKPFELRAAKRSMKLRKVALVVEALR